jgi:hypothetical protein
MSERHQRSFLRRARAPYGDGEDAPHDSGRHQEPREPEGRENAEPNGLSLRRGAELRRSMSLAAERIDEIITTAHETAEQIRAEAEAEAERYVDLRRREADLVVEERVSGLRRTLDAVRQEIDEIEHGLLLPEPRSSEPGQMRPETRSASPARTRPQEGSRPVAYPGRGAGQSDARAGDDRAAALIRASQLAVQGESRERISETLRADFGIEQPDEILDEILPRRW